MIRPLVAALAVAALAGCADTSSQAGVVATDAPLQSLDIQTVPAETIATTVAPTTPNVVATDAPTGDATNNGDATDGEGEAVTTTTESGQGCTYTVVPGDTPIKIANKTGVTLDAFLAANQGSGVLDNLLIGAKVVIPPPGSC